MNNVRMNEKIHNLYINFTNKSGGDTNYNYNILFSNYGIQLTPEDDVDFKPSIHFTM
jgi:hypothetical protein